MSGADTAKQLLTEHNKEHYRSFTLNNKATLSLPEVSSVPWVGASKRYDDYKKTISHPGSDRHIKFITKNNVSHAIIWQTTAEQLKKSVRWGIVKTHSITGKVIAALGQYRVVTHGRVAKGMASNSQAVKLKLLDLFQDRFEALQEIESLANRKLSKADYETALGRYKDKLAEIRQQVECYFSDVYLSGIDPKTFEQLKTDIEADISRTTVYLDLLQTKDLHLSPTSARGQHSIIEFVKQQMIHGLYELQGINQDMSYSKKRYFALTRGEMNDFIEDARKEIDDHQADLHNAVTPKHHGHYSADDSALITYDFSDDQLSPTREREVLLAISFIEEWDKLDNTKGSIPTVSNDFGNEPLDTIAATKWKTHRNFKALFKTIGFYILNMIESIFVPTHPWEGETWANKKFHLIAAILRSHSKPNDPMWQKPARFLRKMAYALVDVFNGIYDFGANLVIRMPANIVNDCASSQSLAPFETILLESSNELCTIRATEEGRLATVLARCKYPSESESPNNSQLAHVEYPLNASEQNDILTAMARGLNGFGNLFSHTIYAKDPVAGLVFTAAYAIGAGAMYLPAYTSSVLGTGYVDWFSHLSYTMSTSKMAATIAGSATQAELCATAWDTAIHGPSGMAMSTLYQYGQDPLTLSAYFMAAYGLGYFLVNGIDGYQIPWLSDVLQADLGTVPDAGYLFVGAKFAVMLYEALLKEPPEADPSAELSVIAGPLEQSNAEIKRLIDRFRLAHWLSIHTGQLPKLEPKQLFAISRQIDVLFNKKESESLHQLLYPETDSSIAFQLLSIPLAYITAILRFAVSLVLSLGALANKNHQPLEPIKRAASNLVDRAKKDLSRLIVFTAHVLYIPYTIVSTFTKMPANLIILLTGRIASLFDAKPAHAMHKAFASVHTWLRNISEFLYPARLLKEATNAHPTHTIKEVEGSYRTLIQRIGSAKKSPTSSTEPVDRHHSILLFPEVPRTDLTNRAAAALPLVYSTH